MLSIGFVKSYKHRKTINCMAFDIPLRTLVVIFGSLLALAVFIGLTMSNADFSNSSLSFIRGTLRTLFS